MKNLNVDISDEDYERLGLKSAIISFDDIKEIISVELAKNAFIKCNRIATATGLDKMTDDEIEAEVSAIRSSRNSN